jgi:hypothetical protein
MEMKENKTFNVHTSVVEQEATIPMDGHALVRFEYPLSS